MAPCNRPRNLFRLAIDLNSLWHSARTSTRAPVTPLRARWQLTSSYSDDSHRQAESAQDGLDTAKAYAPSIPNPDASNTLEDKHKLSLSPQPPHNLSKRRPTPNDWTEIFKAISPVRERKPELQVDDADLLPHHCSFNAIFAREMRRGNYEAVFAMYDSMLDNRTLTTHLDGRTFSAIFDAIYRTTSKDSRSLSWRGGIVTPRNVPPPRAVIKDVTCLAEKIRNKRRVLNTTVLHKAVRTFMAQHDYAAALTTIQLFDTHTKLVGCPALETYRLVTDSLVARIQPHLPRSTTPPGPQIRRTVWAHRFLGLSTLPAASSPEEVRFPAPLKPPEPRGHERGKKDVSLRLRAIHCILTAGSVPPEKLDCIAFPRAPKLEDTSTAPPLQAQPSLSKARVPTALQLAVRPLRSDSPPRAGTRSVVEDEGYGDAEPFSFSLEPLERILKRALVAWITDAVQPGLDAREAANLRKQRADEEVSRARADTAPDPVETRRMDQSVMFSLLF